MIQQIEVKGISCYAYHGCLPEETKIGGNYIVDILLESDFSLAIKSDELQHTVCYSDIYAIVKREMNISSKLIEHVAGRIFKSISTELKNIIYLSVKVTKMSPPIKGTVESCSVVISDRISVN